MYLFKNCECKQKFLLTDKVLLSDFFTLPFFRLKQKNTKKTKTLLGRKTKWCWQHCDSV